MISSNPEDPSQHQPKSSGKCFHVPDAGTDRHGHLQSAQPQRKSQSQSEYPSMMSNYQHLNKLSPKKHSSMKAMSVLEQYKVSRNQYYAKSHNLDFKSNLKMTMGSGSNPFAENDYHQMKFNNKVNFYTIMYKYEILNNRKVVKN